MYCGTCKTDPCLVDSGVICCHQAVRYGYCSGHLDVSNSKDYKAFEAMMDADLERRQNAQERRVKALLRATRPKE
jgi:hypothetical protein